MKPLLILSFFSFWYLTGDRSSQICRTWKQVGYKGFHKAYKPIDPSMAEVITFKKDGTYDKVLYGQMSIKGDWQFDPDSTKIKMAVTSINGARVGGMTIDQSKPTDTLLRLTRDTLVYGTLAYYGKSSEYGHDDLYFVAEGQ